MTNARWAVLAVILSTLAVSVIQTLQMVHP